MSFPRLKPGPILEEEINADYVINIAIIGDVGSGKTSLVKRYCDDLFPKKYNPTLHLGVRTIVKELDNGKKLKCKIWDDGLQTEDYHFLSKCDAVIFVADANNSESLTNLEKYFIPQIRSRCQQGIVKALALTKTDDKNSRVISDDQANTFVNKQHIMPFISGVSAKKDSSTTIVDRILLFFGVKEKKENPVKKLFDQVIDSALARQLTPTYYKAYKEQLNVFLDTQLKRLPSSSKKYEDFNQLKLKINSEKHSSDELRTYVAEARKLAQQHRDRGLVSFFKGTWCNEPRSLEDFKEQFDDQNNIKCKW